MKIIISGGSGRVGQYLIKNHFKGCTVTSFGKGAGNDYDIDILDNVALTKLFTHFKPDVVIHLAALIGQTCEDNPALAEQINVTATKKLAELAVKYNCKKFIFASSASVYNQIKLLPTSETQNLNPRSIYGKTKLQAEQELLKISTYSKVQCMILRIFNIYGKGFNDNLIAKLINSSPENIIEVTEPEKYYRDYIHISDIGKIFEASISKNFINNFIVLNVASGKTRSTAELIAELTKQGVTIYSRVVNGKPSISWANINSLKTTLNISPVTDIVID